MSAGNAFARGVVCAVTGALLWGFSGACAQFLFAHYDISAAFITATRALLAFVLFLGVLVARQRDRLRSMLASPRTLGRLGVFGLGLFGSQFFYTMSVSFTNAGTATVLQMSGTVFIMLFTCVFARKLPRAAEVAGLVCAVFATVAIATQGNLDSLALPPEGLFWGMLNGLAVALYVMWPRRLFAEYGSFAATGLAMFVSAALSSVVWAVQGAPVPALDAVGVLVLTVGIAAVGTFAAFALYLRGVSLVGSVAGGLLGAFEPIGAMVVSAVWLGTAFTGFDWLGLALMLGMLVLVTVRKA
ncbi:MAG: DMT family transporter [Eggerthellaceae bacterium]|nr:DMT family transporter [Eggerthellaceae bacterium]